MHVLLFQIGFLLLLGLLLGAKLLVLEEGLHLRVEVPRQVKVPPALVDPFSQDLLRLEILDRRLCPLHDGQGGAPRGIRFIFVATRRLLLFVGLPIGLGGRLPRRLVSSGGRVLFFLPRGFCVFGVLSGDLLKQLLLQLLLLQLAHSSRVDVPQ